MALVNGSSNNVSLDEFMDIYPLIEKNKVNDSRPQFKILLLKPNSVPMFWLIQWVDDRLFSCDCWLDNR